MRRSTVATPDEYFSLDIAALSGFASLLVLLDGVRDGLPGVAAERAWR